MIVALLIFIAIAILSPKLAMDLLWLGGLLLSVALASAFLAVLAF